MSLSPVKFEETLLALLEQRAFLLLVQLSRKWSEENMLSDRATVLYAKALVELCSLIEAEGLLHAHETVEAYAVLVEIALKRENWDMALERISKLKILSQNHPRLSEFLSLARVAKKQDPQRLIRSHLLEERLKGIEIMLFRGMRQQARVCLEHWKKDLPNHNRIHELHCSSRGDLDFRGDWDELLQHAFDRIHEDDRTHKIPWVKEVQHSDLEDTDQTQIITDNFEDKTEIYSHDSIGDETDSLLMVGEKESIEESSSIDDIVLDYENIVLTNDKIGREPQVLLQKETALPVRTRTTIPRNTRWISWVALLCFVCSFMGGIGFWLLERGRKNLEESVTKAVLSADLRAIQERIQILHHQKDSSRLLREEREDAIALLCSVLWYDFTRAQKDLECVESYVRTDRVRHISDVLFSLGEEESLHVEVDLIGLSEQDPISLFAIREVEKRNGIVRASNRGEYRFVIQDMQIGIKREEIQEGSLPWIDLEILEQTWTLYSFEEKEERLHSLLQPKVSNQLGKQNQGRLLLLRSIFEMEAGNSRKAKLYRLEALDRDPTNSRLRYWLGWDSYEEGALEEASESWWACTHLDVECAMAQVMVLIDMDRLEDVNDLLSEVVILDSRQSLLHRWLEWAQEDIPSARHPVFSDLLYLEERWRGVFSQVEKELDELRDKDRSIRDISWRGLFFLSLEMVEKDANKARKVMSMAIQEQGSALSYVRILGWMNKKEGLSFEDLWKLYLLKKPTGLPAQRIEKELQ
jgi:hypothetical protein